MSISYRRRKYWSVAKKFLDAGLPRSAVRVHKLHRFMTPLAIKVMINELRRMRRAQTGKSGRKSRRNSASA